jgi:hypothetical protein
MVVPLITLVTAVIPMVLMDIEFLVIMETQMHLMAPMHQELVLTQLASATIMER